MKKKDEYLTSLLITGMIFITIALALVAQGSSKEGVRAELIRLQKQTGLRLLSFGSGSLYSLSFATRALSERSVLQGENAGEGAISSDGAEIAFDLRRKIGKMVWTRSGKVPGYASYLGIVGQDGSDLKEFSDLQDPYGTCWSPDKSALTLNVRNIKQGERAATSLQVLKLPSATAERLDAKGDVTAQCWSPNGNQIVYQADLDLRIYDMQKRKSWTLTSGRDPTWSPDGSWIAFLETDGYYVIHPCGEGRKRLFKKNDALTPLWWSPDSRFVAYISRNGFFEGRWWPPIEQGRLRIRRLADNAEDWMTNLYIEGHVPSFQWVEGVRAASVAYPVIKAVGGQ